MSEWANQSMGLQAAGDFSVSARHVLQFLFLLGARICV